MCKEMKQKIHDYICKKFNIVKFCPYRTFKNFESFEEYFVIGFILDMNRNDYPISIDNNGDNKFYYFMKIFSAIDIYTIDSLTFFEKIINTAKDCNIEINAKILPKGTTWESLAIEMDLNP